MNFKHILIALAVSSAAPALAQSAAPATAAKVEVTVGAPVYDAQGQQVGTIEKIDGATAVLNTGKHSASLATASFGRNEKGLLVSMTREQLDAAVEAAAAKSQAGLETALVAGAAVHSSDDQPLGTIKSVSPDGVVSVDRNGKVFALRKDSFTLGANGVRINATTAQIDAAIAQQAAAAPATAKPGA